MKKFICLLLLCAACSSNNYQPSGFSYWTPADPPIGVISTYEVPTLNQCVVMKAPEHCLIRLCGDTTDGTPELDVPVGTVCVEVMSQDPTITAEPTIENDGTCS